MRDRLIELLDWSPMIDTIDGTFADAADYLLENGVIVPPCKVGCTLYVVTELTKRIVECSVIGFYIIGNRCTIITDIGMVGAKSIGKTVFLTREEAEAKLKEGGEG